VPAFVVLSSPIYGSPQVIHYINYSIYQPINLSTSQPFNSSTSHLHIHFFQAIPANTIIILLTQYSSCSRKNIAYIALAVVNIIYIAFECIIAAGTFFYFRHVGSWLSWNVECKKASLKIMVK